MKLGESVLRWWAVTLAAFAIPATVYSQTNSWINPGDGAWQEAANWSLAQSPTNSQSLVVTNDVSKTVTIDSTTSASFSDTLNVSDLILSSPSGATNTLSLLGAGTNTPLFVSNSVSLSHGGLLLLSGSALSVEGGLSNSVSNGVLTVDGALSMVSNSILVADSGMFVGFDPSATGSVLLANGQIVLTNYLPTAIGVNGTGQMIISNGSIQTGRGFVIVGADDGSQGALTMAGGNVFSPFYGHLILGGETGSVGTVTATGGNLIMTNSFMTVVGGDGAGQLNLLNGTNIFGPVEVGGDPGSQGTLTLAGGVANIPGPLIIASGPASTGTMWITGGQLLQTNRYTASTTNFWPTYVGSWGVGTLVMSNGTWMGGTMIVGSESNAYGIVTLNGGIASLWSNLVVGNCSNSALGAVTVAGGSLYVTNTAHNAFIDVRNGQLILNGGLLQMDRLVITNACGLFVRGGGTLIVGSLLLDPNLSAIGDGIPNGWKQQHGLDPLDPTVANADPDGDGFSNLQEFLAGTDPTNSASTFRIISILPEGNDVLITWSVVTNKTYVVQVATNAVDGSSYTNAYMDLATVIVPLSPLITQTNYLDIGAVTNGASRFYRIRLEQ